MVDHYVVTSRVDDLVVIQEEDVVGYIRLEAGDEFGREGDLWVFSRLGSCCTG